MCLSAFINNIAALVITMPTALAVAREHKLPAGAVLMPLSFATILGGMTTLVGTPANLILSSVREDETGVPFGMFDMTPAGGAVALAGLLYLVLVGWRITPRRRSEAADESQGHFLVYELGLPIGASRGDTDVASMRRKLRAAGGALLAIFREGHRVLLEPDARLFHDDRVLVMSREEPWPLARRTGLIAEPFDGAGEDAITARVLVIHGSGLIGKGFHEVEVQSDGRVRMIASGNRAARLKRPFGTMTIEPGDQLYLPGKDRKSTRLNSSH